MGAVSGSRNLLGVISGITALFLAKPLPFSFGFKGLPALFPLTDSLG
jgi:hypothetical protein